MYTGASRGSYFSLQMNIAKLLQLHPVVIQKITLVVGRITAQNAVKLYSIFYPALRSNTLPDLSWTIEYTEEYNGSRYIDPQLWTKETTTAGFIFAFKTLGTIYGTVTVDMDVIQELVHCYQCCSK